MMRAINSSAGSFTMKLILGLVAATFALWGVGDMFRGGVSGGYVLKAGDKVVSLREYQEELNLRYGAMRQVMGAGFTPEIAESLGIKRQVVDDLKTGLLVALEAEHLGLKIPESKIVETMRETAAFQTGGSFNKDSFQMALRRAGISEQSYVESLHKEILSKLILQSFSDYKPDVSETAKLLYQLRNEKRDATFYQFTPKIIASEMAEADDAALDDYYQAYGEQFRIPEYRKFAWITLSKTQLAEDLAVDGAQLKELYEERLGDFTTAEQREVSQLLYETEEMAQKAHTLLQEGKSFAETVGAVKPQNEMLSLGVITRESLPQKAKAPVFALEKEAISEPIQSDFGWHVFRVENITPQKVTSFDEAKAQLKQEWLGSQIEDTIYDITVELEDNLASNIALSESVKELGLTVSMGEFVNNEGKDETGKTITLPKNAPKELAQEGFKLADETDSALLENGDDEYLFLAIEERKESYIPSLSDIKEQVETAWKAKQMRDAQREKSVKLAAGIAKDFTKLQSDIFTPIKGQKIGRNDELPKALSKRFTELPPGLRQEIFRKNKGETTDAYLLDSEKGSYLIARVNDIHALAADASASEKAQSEIEKITAELEKQYGEDMLALYIHYLASKYEVEINETAIAQALR